MNIEEDINKIENKVEKTSFAMEMLTYAKEQNNQLEGTNKRMFKIWLVTFIGLALCLIVSVIYIIQLQNDIGKTTKEIDIEDVEIIDNSHIKIGDDIYNVGEEQWEE